jgi:hypothetical protein
MQNLLGKSYEKILPSTLINFRRITYSPMKIVGLTPAKQSPNKSEEKNPQHFIRRAAEP